jgi:chromosome partitioning protein
MIISIVNQKGGTGKTTSTVNIGSALALKGKRVMLIDLDPQGSLSYSLGLTSFEHSISEAFTGEVLLKDILVTKENMDVIPSNIGLADIELGLADEQERENFLTKILAPIKSEYDFILIDCPPSLSLLTVNALCASDQVIIPMQMEVLSLQGLELINTTI